MKNMLSGMKSYIRKQVPVIIAGTLIAAIIIIMFWLYRQPFEMAVYLIIMEALVLAVTAAVRFYGYYRKHMQLHGQKSVMENEMITLPEPGDILEADYQELLETAAHGRAAAILEKDRSMAELNDYYTLWAHQIKTPISAMNLLLQEEGPADKKELATQLFKVEQYVDMVLQYLRTENISGDLTLKAYSLDEIIHQAVKKYARTFIQKKITLEYDEIGCNVITDEKWMVFVVEQLLSNALKYTPQGKISIYRSKELPDTLVIEDTGIGIAPEDLPRVCERGYTGYNGRSHQKSTGIGLYLCRKILTRLSHTLTITSKPGKGTKVQIGFDSMTGG
ncbi:sensor histidine kinase [Ruminococcus sp. OA3]|uniref:sensor histidine kinase n=1 Tax=Ruminococcus sp. OA3 TaxID=2914164 RepID=UPI001F070E9A|nr:sensor histidine kinase [Ruminococcus sp. OA3]MCH1982067.1 sensor histidine kinase [Ruminococcus sp. OA3]